MAGGRRREHRFWKTFVAFLVMLGLLAAGGWYFLDRSLNRTAALTGFPGRPAKVAGTNWLLVGTDSLTGLTEQRKRQYPTDDGTHLEAVLFFHIPDHDNVPPTLVSLPQAAALTGQYSLDQAYAQGGVQLLAQTVEKETSLYVDHFAEVGFGGLLTLMDDIGGVPGTPPQPDRLVRQREFLHTLFRQATRPGIYLNPSHLFPLMSDAPGALTVDQHDQLTDLVHLALSMRGALVTLTVPLDSETDWDQNKSALLFTEMRHDLPISANLLSM